MSLDYLTLNNRIGIHILLHFLSVGCSLGVKYGKCQMFSFLLILFSLVQYLINWISCSWATNRFRLGTIHLRRRHALGEEGSKICKICLRIVLRNCRRQGGGGQKGVKICRRLKWMVPQIFRTKISRNSHCALCKTGNGILLPKLC